MQAKQSSSNSILQDSNSILRYIIAFASLSFVCTLFLPSVGEEGVYTNITLEMMYNKQYLVPTLYGSQYSRPPLFNWLILLVTNFLGPAKIVIAARLVNMAATLATAGLLYYFVNRKSNSARLAWLSCAVYLSGDLLFRRGWIAYADSTFSLFIFSAVISLWLALDTRKSIWIFAAVLSTAAAFLAKVHTVYIFYAISALVLLAYHPNRRLLFGAWSISLHLVAIIFPIAWTVVVSRGYGGVGTTWLHSQTFFTWPGIWAYVSRIFVLYPLDIIIRFLPTSIIAVLALLKSKNTRTAVLSSNNFKIIFWIIFLNLLPYWLVPASNIRYILPLYPLISWLLADIILNASKKLQAATVICLILCVSLKILFALFWLPYEHKVFRGDPVAIAQDVVERTKGSNLYLNDSTSPGLRVAVELNKMRHPNAPVIIPPTDFNGYVFAENDEPILGKLVHTYKLRNKQMFLLFRASAE